MLTIKTYSTCKLTVLVLYNNVFYCISIGKIMCYYYISILILGYFDTVFLLPYLNKLTQFNLISNHIKDYSNLEQQFILIKLN